jgi:hypothetical protein
MRSPGNDTTQLRTMKFGVVGETVLAAGCGGIEPFVYRRGHEIKVRI